MAQTQFRSDDTVKWWLGFGDGSDGAYSSSGSATDAPIDSSCSGTSGTTSLSATNTSFAAGKPILIHQTRGTGAGAWELNQIQSYVAGTITTVSALKNTYTDSGASQAQVIQLKQYSSFTQNSGHTLTAKAWNQNVGGIIAFLCNGTTTITGGISLVGASASGATAGSGIGFLGKNGGPASHASTGYQGEGTGGAGGTQSTAANGNGAGGGGYYPADSWGGAGGGGGGNGAAGTAGGVREGSGGTVGSGGSAVGNAGLTTMVFGGGGGGGGGDAYAESVGSGGGGGGGGGIMLLISKDISITGTINLNGGGGGLGTWTQVNSRFNSNGGGGAGGSILIKGKTASLGTNKITASGGAGYPLYDVMAAGGNGGVGRIHLDYSVSYSGTTTPTLDYTNDLTITDRKSGALFFAQY